MPSPYLTIQLNARRFAGGLGVIAVLLVLAGLGVVYVRANSGPEAFRQITRQFDLDSEQNVPALFSTLLFFINSALLFLLGHRCAGKDEAGLRRYWLLLGGLFFFLGIDENISIHEMLIAFIRNRMGRPPGVFYFAWVIPYGIATALLAVVIIPWFRKLDGRTRWLFATSAVLFVSGALGMEMVAGRYLEISHARDLNYQVMAVGEETLEMSGSILFTYSLTALLQKRDGQVLAVFA